MPIIKGKGEPYYTPITQYIDWSRESVQQLQNDPKARWQGYEYFFKEGLFISRGGTGNPVIRYAPPGVIDSSGGIYIPTSEKVSARYLSGLLNSSLIQEIIKEFINGTVNTQIQDMRMVPVVIPSESEQTRMEKFVDQAIAARIRSSNAHDPAIDVSMSEIGERSLSKIESDIDELVSDIYEIGDD